MGYRLWVIGGLVAVLTACSTTSSLPSIDDAYYQPEELPGSTGYTSTPSSTSSTSSTGSNIEYLNVQDTTVTIRIKR